MSDSDLHSTLPLVSVITVCFNLVKNARSDYFRSCVESVHKQTYPNIEHLVIDGGSQDGTRELLDSYAAKGWLRFVSEPDDGIYDAMNKGIREAKGKYVVFLNSDDYWHDEKGIAASVEALETSGAAFSYAPRNRVNQQGDFLFREETGIGTFAFLMPFCHQTMFTRRDILLRYNGFDQTRYRSAADYDLVMRLILGGEKSIYVPCNFTTFRSGGFSEAADSRKTKDETYLIRKNLLGESAADTIQKGYLNDDCLQRIFSSVDSSVAIDMLRCLKQDSPGRYTLSYGLVQSYSPDKYQSGYTRNQRLSYCLFGILPIITAKKRNKRTDYSLFGFLPLLRSYRKDAENTQFLLFWILPVFSIRHKSAT